MSFKDLEVAIQTEPNNEAVRAELLRIKKYLVGPSALVSRCLFAPSIQRQVLPMRISLFGPEFD